MRGRCIIPLIWHLIVSGHFSMGFIGPVEFFEDLLPTLQLSHTAVFLINL